MNQKCQTTHPSNESKVLSYTYSCFNSSDYSHCLIRFQHHGELEASHSYNLVCDNLFNSHSHTVNSVVRQIRAPKPSFTAENYRAHILR